MKELSYLPLQKMHQSMMERGFRSQRFTACIIFLATIFLSIASNTFLVRRKTNALKKRTDRDKQTELGATHSLPPVMHEITNISMDQTELGAIHSMPSEILSTNQLGVHLARAFPAWDSKYSWCTFEYDRTKPTGLLYVKLPKAASSTIAGIAQRIAIKHGHKKKQCMVQDRHVKKNDAGRKYGNRDRQRSFLWSAVRDPAGRAMSRIFFSRISKEMIPSDENIIKALHNYDMHYGAVSNGKGGFQLAYLSLHEIEERSFWTPKNRTSVLNHEHLHYLVQVIIEEYDFLMVVERMEESLVALQLLLKLDPGDIISTASKVGGGYYFTRSGECMKLAKSFISPGVKEYLSSEEWYAKNYGDYLLLAAANHSLDLTIERLGQERFDAALSEFRRLKSMEEKLCAPLAIFPCSEHGTPQPHLSKPNCYERDHGCGYPCIDQMLLNKTKF